MSLQCGLASYEAGSWPLPQRESLEEEEEQQEVEQEQQKHQQKEEEEQHQQLQRPLLLLLLYMGTSLMQRRWRRKFIHQEKENHNMQLRVTAQQLFYCHTAAIAAGAGSSKFRFWCEKPQSVLVQPHFTGDARSLDANDF